MRPHRPQYGGGRGRFGVCMCVRTIRTDSREEVGKMSTGTAVLVTEQCDQDRNGTETAQMVVYTGHGPLYLCQHHYNRNAMLLLARGYTSRPLHDD